MKRKRLKRSKLDRTNFFRNVGMVYRRVENKLKRLISTKKYGIGISKSWDFLFLRVEVGKFKNAFGKTYRGIRLTIRW